ncbi:GNAT family N-acetyltransferase [Bacillus sp. XF8]|uniref:GNAT family N-acetyltransferase n=1 Tax=Bacillus sp. XF8 TaxID=2819289 RepID=UPI001AA031BA|nr:GNAT family N-acetyltransferase [Bacillus sp. XF8]MBO1582607.1 GNAT family N-acetyltransferase [Bacillus sp. XF8]
MKHLGYPTTIEKKRIRLQNIFSHLEYYTLVAEVNECVIGMIGLYTGMFYTEDGVYARIIALVVDEEFRKQGIGKRLIKAAEKWTLEQGTDSIGLNSGNCEERKHAHQFYKRMGYIEKSTGFVKSLL